MKSRHSLLIGTAFGALLPLLTVNAAEVDYSNTATTTLGHALHLAADGDDLAAVATLLMADKKGSSERESDASRFYIAETLRSRGVMDEASRYYLAVANDASAKQHLRDVAWLTYAKIRHEQGNHTGALAALQNIKKGLSDTQKGDFAMIKAHALLAAGKPQEAVTPCLAISNMTASGRFINATIWAACFWGSRTISLVPPYYIHSARLIAVKTLNWRR